MKKISVFIMVFNLSMLFFPMDVYAQVKVSYSLETAASSFNFTDYGFLVEPCVNLGQFTFGIGTKYSVAPSNRTVYNNPHGSLCIANAQYLACSVDVQYQIPSKSSWSESFKLGFSFLNFMVRGTEIYNGVATERPEACRDDPYVTLGAKTAKRFLDKLSISVMPFFSYYFEHYRDNIRADIGLQLGVEYCF